MSNDLTPEYVLAQRLERYQNVCALEDELHRLDFELRLLAQRMNRDFWLGRFGNNAMLPISVRAPTVRTAHRGVRSDLVHSVTVISAFASCIESAIATRVDPDACWQQINLMVDEVRTARALAWEALVAVDTQRRTLFNEVLEAEGVVRRNNH